ncbi:hypothetical protein FACS1894218_0620 [Bacilli bacterium]|nr:hypothetical protein FACS1894218_0620 [Bacilli bacterium]
MPTLALDNNAYCSLIDGVLTLNSTPTDYQTVKVTANYTNDIGSAVPQSVNITLIPDSPIPDHYQTTPSKGVLDNLDDVVTLVTTNNGDPVDATYTTTSTDVTIDGNAVKYTNLVDIQQNIVIKATVDGKIVSDTVITLEPATPIPDHYQTTPSKGVLDNLDDVVTLVTTNNGDPVDATYTTTSTDVTIDGNAVKYTNLVDIQQNIVIKATVDGKIVSDTVITLEPATPIPDHYQTTPSK